MVAIIAGILQGSGSICAAVGQLAVPNLQTRYGWAAAFYFMMAVTAVGVLALLPEFIRNVKNLLQRRTKRKGYMSID